MNANSTSVAENPRNVNQNPPVSPHKKHTILRVLDFFDTGRGMEASELKTRAGFDRGECDRGINQLENAGLVKSVLVSKSGKAKSDWSTSPGFTLTDAGRMALAMEPAAFAASEVTSDPTPAQTVNTCMALMVRPACALVPARKAAPVFAFHYMMKVWEQYVPAETFTCARVFATAPF